MIFKIVTHKFLLFICKKVDDSFVQETVIKKTAYTCTEIKSMSFKDICKILLTAMPAN